MVAAGKHLSHARLSPLGTLQRVVDWRAIAGIIIGVGILLRLFPYFHNRSLWLDESWLALNILQKSYSQLMGVLNNGQMAPIGFLSIEKFMVLSFGDSEYVLRAFPLLAGIFSLFLFYGVARRVLTSRGLLMALGLFAVSSFLIRYSSELKQYSSDVMIALGISLLGLVCMEKESRFLLSLFSIAGSILIWFSHSAIFSLAGVGIALTLYYLKARKWQNVAWLSLPALFWLGSFALNYFVTLRDLSQNRKMVKAWSSAFMPMVPVSTEDFMWYLRAFFDMFHNPGGLSLYGLAALCFVIGGISMFSEKRYACYVLTLPMLFTLFASGLNKYPFGGRLILFLVPMMLILIGEGVDRIITLTKPTGRIVWVTLCILLFMYPVHNAIATMLNPGRLDHEEVRPVMTYLSQNYREGDRLYLYHSSEPAFEYYAKRVGLEKAPYQRGVARKRNWDNYIIDLRRLQGKSRVWVLFSHVDRNHGIDEEQFYLYALDGMGKQTDSFKKTGASIYLYDLRTDSIP